MEGRITDYVTMWLEQARFEARKQFAQHSELEENIAVIVFGKETKFLHYYSTDYPAIKQSIENLECCGPSPLTAALLLSIGGLSDGSAHTKPVGEFQLAPRVVVFTDGRPTGFSSEIATEQDEEHVLDESILRPLFLIVQGIGTKVSIFCFPVGKNPNYGLLNAISLQSNGGRILEIYKAKWFGRFTLHYRGAEIVCRITNQRRVERGALRKVVETTMPHETYDEDDLDTIYEIVNNKARILAIQEKKEEDPIEEYFKEKYNYLPKLGTRVRRGPHWTFDDQDSEGPGTVTGHGDFDGTVYVQWDTGMRGIYPYGDGGIFGIVVCDEPRFPLDGLAAVGCFVKRGPDWQWENQDGGVGSIGTVYRTMDDATVYVRWPCGRKGNYRFGYDGKFDIDVCDPFSPDVINVVKKQEEEAKYRNSSNDFKEKDNTEETSHMFSHGKECTTSNVTCESRDQNVHIDLENLLSQGRLNAPIVSEEKDIETDVCYTDSVSTNNVYDSVCFEKKYSWNNVQKSKCDSSKKYVCPGACVGACCSEELIPKSSDEYQNDLSVKEIITQGENNTILPDESVMSFSHIEIPHSKHENLPETTKGMTINILSKNMDDSNINFNKANRCWQWLDRNGLWIDYPEHVNSLINKRLQQRPNTTVVIAYNNQSFRVVAHKLLQINTESKEKHKIRWKD